MTRFVVSSLALALCAFAFSTAIAADDIYLRCNGAISFFRSHGIETVERQEIAAHLKSGRVSFSGNSLLIGKNIEICTPSDAEMYFDIESCRGRSRTDPRRVYGTLNKITGALSVTSTSPDATTHLIEGRFQCATVAPAVK